MFGCLVLFNSFSTPRFTQSSAPPAPFHNNPCLHSTTSTLPRASLGVHVFRVAGIIHHLIYRCKPTNQANVVLNTYIEVLSKFVPLIISLPSRLSPPITIRSLICRAQARNSTIPLVALGSPVEAPQEKPTAYSFRDRVGEQCSLLFLLLFQPHVFQVCSSHRVLNTPHSTFLPPCTQCPRHITRNIRNHAPLRAGLY